MLVVGKRHRPFLANDALGGSDTGAIDQDARWTVVGGGLGDRRLGAGAVGYVAVDGDAVDVDRNLGGCLGVDVEEGNLGAGSGQHARRRGAEAGAPAGDERRMSTNIHDQLAFAVGIRRTTRDDDVGRRRIGVKVLDQSGAMGKHRALVDRTFVGDLAHVKRRRFGEQNGAADAGRRAAVRIRRALPESARMRF